MGFVASVKSCLRKYGDFGGRAPRSEFWYFYLFIMLSVLVVMGLAIPIVAGISGDGVPWAIIVPLVMLFLGLIVPYLSAAARRLHDSGRSAWWLLLMIVPYGGLVLLVFYVIRGTSGSNAYGPDPLEDQADVFG